MITWLRKVGFRSPQSRHYQDLLSGRPINATVSASLAGGLTAEQKLALVEKVPGRLNKLYHTGFKYESSRQFCSKFVFDIYKEALCIPVGEIETFGELLNSNPNAKLTFWKFWFLGAIPWDRKTVTPASLWHHPSLMLIHAEGVETPQPELTEA